MEEIHTWESEGGALHPDPASSGSPAKVLLCTSIGPGKEYSLGFLLAIVRGLEGIAGIHIVLDGVPATGDIADLPEALKHLAENEVVLYLHAPGEDDNWASDPGARVARVREAQRLAAIEGDYTHAYLHDADMIPPIDIVTKLLEHKEAVATGFYNIRGRRGVELPTAPIPNRTTPVPLYGLASLQRDGPYFRTVHFGMGCMLITRDLLERIPFRTPQSCAEGRITEDVAWGADLADLGGNILLDPALSCWHANNDGTANRLLVGEETSAAIWTDTPFFVHNRLGEWQAGVPHYGLSEADLQSLGPGFLTGHYPRLTVEVQRTEEILECK